MHRSYDLRDITSHELLMFHAKLTSFSNDLFSVGRRRLTKSCPLQTQSKASTLTGCGSLRPALVTAQQQASYPALWKPQVLYEGLFRTGVGQVDSLLS